jgi:hypothetical protein
MASINQVLKSQEDVTKGINQVLMFVGKESTEANKSQKTI